MDKQTKNSAHLALSLFGLLSDDEKVPSITSRGDDKYNPKYYDTEIFQHLMLNHGSFKKAYDELIAEYGKKILTDKIWQVDNGPIYSPGYSEVKSLDEQIDLISNIWDLETKDAKELSKAINHYGGFKSYLPNYVEGWFALPNIRFLLQRYYPKMSFCEGYNKLIKKSMEKLSQVGNTYHYGLEEEPYILDTKQMRESTKSIETRLDGPIILIPAQFGKQYQGWTPRTVLNKLGNQKLGGNVKVEEFGLGIFHVVCMLLTHPERLWDVDKNKIPTPCASLGALCLGDFTTSNSAYSGSDLYNIFYFIRDHQRKNCVSAMSCNADSRADVGAVTGFNFSFAQHMAVTFD